VGAGRSPAPRWGDYNALDPRDPACSRGAVRFYNSLSPGERHSLPAVTPEQLVKQGACKGNSPPRKHFIGGLPAGGGKKKRGGKVPLVLSHYLRARAPATLSLSLPRAGRGRALTPECAHTRATNTKMATTPSPSKVRIPDSVAAKSLPELQALFVDVS